MNRLVREHKLKSILLFMLLIISLLGIVHGVMYFSVRRIVEDQIKFSAQTVATSVANTIMENVEAYKLFCETKNTYSLYYRDIRAYFANIKAGSNIKFIFTEREIDSETIECILDSEPTGSPDSSPPGAQGPNDWMRRTVYANKTPTSFDGFFYPGRGNLIVAYAPIFDTEGEFLGIAGASIANDELFNRLTNLNLVMLSLYATLLAIIIAILMKSSGVFLEPLVNDKLTGAINKRYFDIIMKKEILYAFKDKTNDLDHFKNINDTYGHIFGDHVLASVAATIRKFLRQNDYFIRYGGEEFAMILPNVSLENARGVAERIRQAVEDTPCYNTERELEVRVTISIGIASADKAVFDSKTLLQSADKALYEAKRTRNSIAVFQK